MPKDKRIPPLQELRSCAHDVWSCRKPAPVRFTRLRRLRPLRPIPGLLALFRVAGPFTTAEPQDAPALIPRALAWESPANLRAVHAPSIPRAPALAVTPGQALLALVLVLALVPAAALRPPARLPVPIALLPGVAVAGSSIPRPRKAR
jgi:hypothetical protein